MIEKLGVDYVEISCGKLRRYFSWENFTDIFRVVFGVMQARKALKKFKADIVFSKGGYVSLPVCTAAWNLKIPVITHESDLVPGLANKIIGKVANKICTSFEETSKYLKKTPDEKIVYTGTPVRKEIFEGDRNEGYRFTGFDDYRPVILIMGGSQGAQQINELVRASLDELLKRFQIVHITGRGKLDIGTHKKGYVQYEYLDEDLKNVYSACDIIVSRGGANSLFEIAMLKKKAVIIPLSLDGSRGDQIDNSKIFVRKLGWSMLSGNISREDFIEAIEMAMQNDINTDVEFKNGTKEIVKLILKK